MGKWAKYSKNHKKEWELESSFKGKYISWGLNMKKSSYKHMSKNALSQKYRVLNIKKKNISLFFTLTIHCSGRNNTCHVSSYSKNFPEI
ncbi:hypothetical protein ABEB36_006389 [Hypothenemus hampei]|uniref:Uncharacterized protein n=1 Tax=Hypothenemus hampei TaxID=57062 RepID=A0ABD1EQD5_HYPHA